MKKILSRMASLVGTAAVGVVLNAAIAFAQNPSPAQPENSTATTNTTNTNAAGRRDRGNRGPGGGGNQETSFQRGGRGNIGGWGLDEKQTELLREAMAGDVEEVRKLDEKLRTAQRELVQAVVAQKYDEKIVREKAEAVAKLQTDLTMLRAKQLATVAPTLNPEQREQWENSPIALGLLLRGGGAGNPGLANAGNNRFGAGPGNPRLDRGDRNGFQGGTPENQQPGGRSLRRGNEDPRATDQPRRRGAGQ